jgi:hypothetical protein
MAIWQFSGNWVYFPPFWYIVSSKIWQPCFQYSLDGLLSAFGLKEYFFQDQYKNVLQQKGDPILISERNIFYQDCPKSYFGQVDDRKLVKHDMEFTIK